MNISVFLNIACFLCSFDVHAHSYCNPSLVGFSADASGHISSNEQVWVNSVEKHVLFNGSLNSSAALSLSLLVLGNLPVDSEVFS